MDILYAPWRQDYTTTTAHGPQGQNNTTQDVCVFCTLLNEHNDEKNLILTRTQHCFIMLNKFPYNGGHLLILPYQHEGTLSNIAPDIQNELMSLSSKSTAILEKVLKPAGFNIGINMGKAAGAGIPAHLHIHLLPRWVGDTNFLPTISSTKTVSTDLTQLYHKLKKYFLEVK